MFALFPINQYLYMVVDHHRVHRGTQSNTFFCQYVLGITCLGILSRIPKNKNCADIVVE